MKQEHTTHYMKWSPKTIEERGFKGKPFIDIVAGTSIGAINSAVLVDYVMENNTWEGSSERLNEFWEYLSKESSLDHIPGFTYWWDYFHNNVNGDIATGEAARRYYTAKEFSVIGVPTVFSPLMPQLILNSLILKIYGIALTVDPLKRSLERFAKFPIATTFDERVIIDPTKTHPS